MRLNMRLDVLFPAKLLSTVFKRAHVFAVDRIWSINELGNVIDGDVGVLDRSFDARFKIQICD